MKIPEKYKERHKCDRCGSFSALWSLDWARWCDKCVQESGGLIKAAHAAKEIYLQAHPAPQVVDIKKNQPPHPSRPDPGIPERRSTPPIDKDPKLWKKAQKLSAAMRMTAEQAYEELIRVSNLRDT